MGLSQALSAYLQTALTAHENREVYLHKATPVSGGSINETYCLHTSAGKYMIKINNRVAFPSLFALEAAGLGAIQQTHTIATPQVKFYGDFDDQSFLLLEWIETGPTTAAASALLGQQLAQLHRNSNPLFGLNADNYMGSLPQSNRRHGRWCDFFVQERLLPMVNMALSKGLLTANDGADFEDLYARLPQLFEEEPPALLHGDLWSGNYLINSTGQPYLIDPAVSYGHREFDIAMTTLFGGFNKEFHEAYNEAFPLAGGWQQRLSLWNLYPLLFHLNIFGKTYLNQVKVALQTYF